MDQINRSPSRSRQPEPIGQVPILRKVEVQGLLSLTLVSALLLGFVLVAGWVQWGDAGAFDETILRWFRNPADPADPIGPFWVEAGFRDITALGGYTVLSLLTLLAVSYLLIEGKRASALLVAAAILGGTILSNVLKFGFNRQRPTVVDHLIDVHSLSFPSGHAMLSAIAYLTLGALLARTQRNIVTRTYIIGVAIFLTLVIGISRIFLGVHYPTDVLAGWCAGSAWAFLCWWLARWLQKRGSVEPST
ncbi:phosphatase PAP2 family protein [Aureimonas sp. ME7]|uniref:phosphatase PAP2 family protein n=1 Tax=Aureimonas sp. ME7 TaxID=2744252 RepID=UPI0015F4ED0B|nr:phosphatase PAP2 family protein [Aureimonas sp. ME7]